MKSSLYSTILLSLFLILFSCEQEWPEYPPPDEPEVPDPGVPDPGSADFSRFVVVGNSLSAGFQSNALFDMGQFYSLGNILADQFTDVGGGEFIQPDINTENGFSGFADDGTVLGRLILAGDPPVPTPTISDPSAIPSPLNPLFDYNGPQINNYSVPGLYLGQALIPETGNPTSDFFNPFYWRFASSPGVSTLIGDATDFGGSFFLFWLGNNDVLLYAVNGAYDAPGEPPLTSEAEFAIRYRGALSLMTSDEEIKGVVGNIPDITSLPYFKLVPWNSIVFEEGDPLIDFINNSTEVQGYNAGMALAANLGLITQEEAALRIVQFAPGGNGILVEDESLTPVTGLPAPFPPSLPNVRLANENDLIGLAAGAVLGTLADPNNPLSVIGIGFPLADEYTLLSNELAEVQDRTNAFNAIIENTISAIGVEDRVALADINARFKFIVDNSPLLIDGVSVTPGVAPPTGIFSEDGVHPNSRGYAITANTFIDAINNKFGANVHQVNIGEYPGTALPQ